MGRKQETKPVEAKPEEAKPEEKEEDPPLIKELKVLDDKYLELERACDAEIQEARRKIMEKQKPLLEARAKVLAKNEAGGDATGTPAIPGFWLQAMKNMPQFEDIVQKHDEPVLQHLTDITTENVDPKDSNKGFKLHFHFSENPYFTNKVLSKTYIIEESSPYTQEPCVKKITGTEIDWNAGKDVTVEKVAKKVKGGGAKKAKAKAKETVEPRESFFREFFKDLEPGMDVPDDLILDQDMEDVDDDDDELLELFMDRDPEIGSGVREQLIPFAVRWYTGEAAPEQDDDEDSEEEDDDDDDDEEDDSDDEPPAKGGKAKAKAKGGKPEKQEECKQQ
jgi:nucleosome assembly protein 1-like 1